MAITSSRSKYERKKAENNVVDDILESLSISLEVVLKMVARLGLETPKALQRQVREGDFCLFLALARLLEAYGSRFAPPGTVYLALEYRAPSWSWAAVGDSITYTLVTLDRPQIDHLVPTTAHIEEINLVPAGPDPQGRLKAASITIRGKLKYYKPSSLSRTMAFHFDFDDEVEDTPVYLLSLFTSNLLSRSTITIFLESFMGWALALIMIEEPVPVFRQVGVVSHVCSEWFDDAMDVVIPII